MKSKGFLLLWGTVLACSIAIRAEDYNLLNDYDFSSRLGNSEVSVPVPKVSAAQQTQLEKPDILKCSICYNRLNDNYLPSGLYRLKELSKNIRPMSGYTSQEARNYFEATGFFLIDAQVDTSEETKNQEKQKLREIVKAGRFYYGNAVLNVGTGAWNCLTHAKRLKEHLAEHLSQDYIFEIVNSWNDPSKLSVGNILFANHYMIRAISLKTGHSYVCDGYKGTFVKSEEEDKRIIFNDFEECVYEKYLKMKYGNGFGSIAAQWTPLQKGLIARNSKHGAGICLSGKTQLLIDSIFDLPIGQ
ncbi:MAG: hypothetical protein L6420_02580 [Elusimicrobia bacterium]|nr:hypothetical protein [Elusimicrobiota bacterium]